jgi:hypothetical protein
MVLVSDTYNFMYLVNPKTGSTSMRKYLRCYGKYIKDSQYDIYTLQDKIKDISVTYNYDMYHNNSVTAKLMCETLNKDYNKYFSFIHIRNPWAKMVSRYFFDKPDKNWFVVHIHSNYDKETAFYYNFNEWLKNIDFSWSNIEKWIGEEPINKIYPIETFTLKQLENDINEFNKERGVPILKLDGELGYENTTVHDHYSRYYNEESIEIVRKALAKDIELGGYTFERV